MCDQSGNTASSQKRPKISKKCHLPKVISTTSRIQLCYLVKMATFFHKNSRKDGQIFPKSATLPKVQSGFTAERMNRFRSNLDTKFVSQSCTLGKHPQWEKKKCEVAFDFGRERVCETWRDFLLPR